MLLVVGGFSASFCSPLFGGPFLGAQGLPACSRVRLRLSMPALVRFSIFATVLTLGSPTPTCTSVVWPNCVLYSYSLLLFLASQLAIVLPT
jgi:hypothetical protein